MRCAALLGPALAACLAASGCSIVGIPSRASRVGSYEHSSSATTATAVDVRWQSDRSQADPSTATFRITCEGRSAVVWTSRTAMGAALAAQVCRVVADRPDVLQPVPADAICTAEDAFLGRADVTVRRVGGAVTARFDGGGGCELGRWRELFGTTLDALTRGDAASLAG